MKLNKKIRTSHFILDLSRLNDSLCDPSFIALLSDGWEVFSYIPVEDNGPKVILLLKENHKKNYSISFYAKIIAFLNLAIAIACIVNIFLK